MPFFSGFAAGFGSALEQNRQTELKKAQFQEERENAFLQHMATADNPDIKAAALMGLSQKALGRPSKGLRGFLGEYDANPAMPQLRDLIQQTRMPAADQPPTGQVPPSLMAPPEQGGAALPSTSPTQPGGPPMRGAGAPPGPVSFHAQAQPIWWTPEERARRQAEAQVSGKISAFRQGMREATTPEEQQLVRAEAGIRMPFTGQFMGNIQDEHGNWYRQERFIDPATGVPNLQRFPTAPPPALQGLNIETLADEQGRPAVYGTDKVTGKPRVFLGYRPVGDIPLTYTDPNTQEQWQIQVPRTFQQPPQTPEGRVLPTGGGAAPATAPATTPPPAAPGGLIGARPGETIEQVTARERQEYLGGGPAAGGGAVAGAATAPAAAPVAAPAAPAAAGAPAPTAATAPPPTRPTAPTRPAGLPTGAVSKGRVGRPTDVVGAVIDDQGNLQEVTAQRTVDGKYLKPGTQQEFAGFIPGKPDPTDVRAVANLQATRSAVARAREALQTAGIATNNDPKATADLAWKYWGGRGEDPIGGAMLALNDFVSISGASSLIRGNSRAVAYIHEVQRHMPRIPHTMGTVLSHYTGGALGPRVADVAPSWLGGGGYDSGALMDQKLALMDQNLANIQAAIRTGLGKTPEHAVGGEGGGATPTTTAPPVRPQVTPAATTAPPTAPAAAPTPATTAPAPAATAPPPTKGPTVQQRSPQSRRGTPKYIEAKDPQGVIHWAPAGTPLPTGWTLVTGAP
jgi:hypothetical protein